MKRAASIRQSARSAVRDLFGAAVRRSLATLGDLAAIRHTSRAASQFYDFGRASLICFPATTIMNERYISIGDGTILGPHIALSAGMVPGQVCVGSPVVQIGSGCLIGRGSGIVGHLSIVIEDQVWTGHHVYITDQNHGYDDLDRPIAQQFQPERPVRIGTGSWIGHGAVIAPGAQIGRHCVIGANSVVTGDIPDYSVAVGAPARVIRQLS